ncbi:hypothetical protein OVA03_14810 [Asticcacaulis sp. SL142]|uniref:hypothetical protein n=1 Tax=Asticcacaulis sp. SL142 TaxID=2995155 RepID=UPI00226CEFCE|nr:hypothetical protein [Asticcacaulis sp. SL142]WAC47956.1 hypothetical protein OVA03_14810 [Asticcacaulis sp. SL142]
MAPHDPNHIDTDEPGKPPVRGFPWVIITAVALVVGLLIAFAAINPSSSTNNAADAVYQDNHEGSISDPASTQAVGVN